MNTNHRQATVVRTAGATCTLLLDDGTQLECRVKGRFRLQGIRSTNPVAVGDRVQTDGDYITALLPRRNILARRSPNLSKQSHILAANIDLCLLVVTLSRPETSTTFIDRVLASAEAYRVPVLLCVNKTDEITTPALRERLEQLRHTYTQFPAQAQPYELITLSALAPDTAQGENADIARLRTRLRGRLTLLAGHSGVGKSTLLNRLCPQACAKTAPVSEANNGAGQHTTTLSRFYPLPVAPSTPACPGDAGPAPCPGAGGLIDIPGIKGFGTYDMEPAEVAHYFRDIFALGQGCRFRQCTHTHEPGCAVRQALDDGRLAPTRYTSYLSMLADHDEDRYRPAY